MKKTIWKIIVGVLAVGLVVLGLTMGYAPSAQAWILPGQAYPANIGQG